MKLRLIETDHRVSFLDIQKLVSENNAFFFVNEILKHSKVSKKMDLTLLVHAEFVLFICLFFHLFLLLGG